MYICGNKLYLLLIFALIFFGISCSNGQDIPDTTAENGLFLLNEHSSDEHSLVKLDGEWEFYYEKFYTEDDFAKDSSPNKYYFNLPGFWNDKMIDGTKLKGTGFATYRLIVRLPDKLRNRSLGLYVPHAFTAYHMYINGKLELQNGTPGKNAWETKEFWLPSAVFFTTPDPEIEIIIHVSNFKSLHGGFRQSIELGTAEDVLNTKQMRLVMDLVLVGGLFVISLLHLCIYLIRPEDKSILYFSIYAFLGVLYKVTSGEYFLVMLFPEINWGWLVKIFLLSVYLTFPVLLSFVKKMFPEETPGWIARTMQCLFAIPVVFVVFSESSWLEYSLIPGEVLVMLCCLFVLYIFVRAVIRKKESAIGFLAGFLIFVIAIINDILFEKNIIRTEVYSPIGSFVMFFSQAFFLSKKFTNVLFTVEKQNIELEQSVVIKEKLFFTNIQSKRMELELLKKTIQPHFLMNSLSAIRYWVMENPERSTDILDALAGELRIIQNVANKKQISIIEEFKLCECHVAVMGMRMEKTYRLKLRGFVGDETVPPLVFHTLLENAFTHDDSEKAKLSFCIWKKKNAKSDKNPEHYCFIVHNHSRNSRTSVTKNGSGTGMEYIRLRLEESYPGNWKLEHGKSKTGYRVLITIKTED
ncbi:7TM diverse intracellular signaling domain-containing protein [Leptospira ilyithenensis]|uniref:Histidine kinase n=1 Tax=Leptospira ilyithenensis TaxID=2484901 RepID=A0A4R9LR97_9LEPT|nr:7TM diverse intracellular signaling domain-containing protein [Leptospira ilyithenensis]TGN10402.1 histidine kinase [Leptospira ilyithenensis]